MVSQLAISALRLKILIYLRRKRLRERIRQRSTGRRRRFWVREVITERDTFGEFHSLIQKMRQCDPEWHFKYFRMTAERFDQLLALLEPKLRKQDTNFRKAISPGEMLAVTLRYLVTGDAQQTIAMSFRLGKSTVSKIIRRTLVVIWEVLSPLYLPPPTKDDWAAIARGFEAQWNFPHCIGAMDGKHCVIQAPKLTGSEYFNYKKTFSMVLLAVCDANYKFTVVDFGERGKFSDGGVFATSTFGQNFNDGNLDIPPPSKLPYSDFEMPYVIIADEAFPLKENLMRPYPGNLLDTLRRIFNYRLSRGRRVIENAFGIMSSRLRIFRRAIIGDIKTLEAIIGAGVCVHNFLRHGDSAVPPAERYCPPGYADSYVDGVLREGDWRREAPAEEGASMQDLSRAGTNTYRRSAASIRDELANYFVGPGEIPWQYQAAFRAYDFV